MPARLGGDATEIKNAKFNTANDHTGGTDLKKIIVDGVVR